MKLKTLLIASVLALSPALKAEGVIIYLIDPDEISNSELSPVDIQNSDEDSTPELPPTSAPTEKTASQKLDELIERIRREQDSYSEKHKRLARQLENEQKEFLSLLNDFLIVPFNKADDGAELEFVEVRARIGKFVFNAPTKQDYYDRLYLINAVYRNNRNQRARFDSLNRELNEINLEREAFHRKIRTIITGASTLIGLGLGGYLSYEASKKIIPLVANEGGFSSLAKYAGRAGIVVVGAGVGAGAGAYLGFLGSDFIFQNQREFLDPVQDGDLREILDYRDEDSTSTLPRF